MLSAALIVRSILYILPECLQSGLFFFPAFFVTAFFVPCNVRKKHGFRLVQTTVLIRKSEHVIHLFLFPILLFFKTLS